MSVNADESDMQSGTKFIWVNTGTIDASKVTPEIDHKPVLKTLTSNESTTEKEKGFIGSSDSIEVVHEPVGSGVGGDSGGENVMSLDSGDDNVISLNSCLKDAVGNEPEAVDGRSGCQLVGRLNTGCEEVAANSPGQLKVDSSRSGVCEQKAVVNDDSLRCNEKNMGVYDSIGKTSDDLENLAMEVGAQNNRGNDQVSRVTKSEGEASQAMKVEAQNNAGNDHVSRVNMPEGEASQAEGMDMIGSPNLCTKRNGALKSEGMDVTENVTSKSKLVSPPEKSALMCDAIGERDNILQKTNKKEGEFCISDLVWGKVRSHPWWPGQIFDPSDASNLAKKYSKPNTYLIAYFGDKSFAWIEEHKLKPFWQHFSEMEKQSGTESFQFAVNCALDEASRRIELGLACLCLANDIYDELRTQVVVNAGIQEKSSRIQDGDRYYTALSFEPVKFVDHVRALARSPGVRVDRLESMITRAQLFAFYRWKGQHHMAEYNLLERSLESEPGSFAGEKQEFTEEGGVPDLNHGELDNPGKETLKGRGSLSRKRKGISIGSSTSGMKERRLSDLLSRKSGVEKSKKKTKVSEGKRSVSFSGKKSKSVDVLSRSPNVGERIQNAASLLSKLSPVTKDDNDKILSPPEYAACDFGKMFSELLSVAVDPLKGLGSVSSMVSCFSDFRNSVVQTSIDGKWKKRSASPEVEEDVSCKKFKKEESVSEVRDLLYDFEAAQDSYWTDRVISVPEEKAFLGNVNETNDPIEAATEPGMYAERSGPESFTIVNSSNNNKIMEESSPAALILNFSDADSIPSEANLNQIFNRYGPLATSETEVVRNSKRCKVVFKRRADADAAFSSSGKFQIFGPSLVSYRVNYDPVMGKTISPAKKQCKKGAKVMKDGTTA